ncbi:hypothetical protein [Actinomadura rupiterrae]|uniref:hypothetical protein n=1 Tax=Actinomadura rupiterrae TaxID=559627 RepID=UPI0020A34D96|nr:hypothetical protein [Actinomadura rupiterrae]MCP2337866.1 hypothetical protein [Actinomadura rupiterrae]
MAATEREALVAEMGPQAVPPGTAARLNLDALTLNMLTDGMLELVWTEPSAGLGRELEELQHAVGDGPSWRPPGRAGSWPSRTWRRPTPRSGPTSSRPPRARPSARSSPSPSRSASPPSVS